VQITFRILKFDVTSVRHESLNDTFNVLKKNFAGNR